MVLNDSVRLQLRRPDGRTTVLAALSSLGLLTYHPGDHSPPRPDPPWSRPPPAPTAMTNVSKSMLRGQQLMATLAAIEDSGPTDIQVYTDGSINEGTTDGGAGMVAMSGEDIIERWHVPTGRWSSSYQAEKSAMVRAISWLDEYEDWQSALVICDSRSLVETLANSNQPEGDVFQLWSLFLSNYNVSQCSIFGHSISLYSQCFPVFQLWPLYFSLLTVLHSVPALVTLFHYTYSISQCPTTGHCILSYLQCFPVFLPWSLYFSLLTVFPSVPALVTLFFSTNNASQMFKLWPLYFSLLTVFLSVPTLVTLFFSTNNASQMFKLWPLYFSLLTVFPKCSIFGHSISLYLQCFSVFQLW